MTLLLIVGAPAHSFHEHNTLHSKMTSYGVFGKPPPESGSVAELSQALY